MSASALAISAVFSSQISLCSHQISLTFAIIQIISATYSHSLSNGVVSSGRIIHSCCNFLTSSPYYVTRSIGSVLCSILCSGLNFSLSSSCPGGLGTRRLSCSLSSRCLGSGVLGGRVHDGILH